VDGQGIYCLDAGISDEYQPETDAVEFVLEKLVIGSAVAMAVVFQSVSPVSRTMGRGEFRQLLQPSVALSLTLIVLMKLLMQLKNSLKTVSGLC